MDQTDILDIFERSGALLKGHFVLRSGRHSREFFQCALALQEMPVVEILGAELARRCAQMDVRTVVAPAMGGLVIGQEVARCLRSRFIFLEKDNGKLVLRRGFKLTAGERCLVVEDVVTQGGRALETINILRTLGAQVVAVAMLVDRSTSPIPIDVPLIGLVKMQVETFDPNQLPVDLQESPAVKPGS